MRYSRSVSLFGVGLSQVTEPIDGGQSAEEPTRLPSSFGQPGKESLWSNTSS